ncbi:MAG: hypothetical protein KAU95_02190 [Candidatus Aenigmarchaeota archaeon]|nr:hypothetical protein [Candidatus Aenigmarchaeota archaeon]
MANLNDEKYEKIIKEFDEKIDNRELLPRKKYLKIGSKLKSESYSYEEGDFLYLIKTLGDCPTEEDLEDEMGDEYFTMRCNAANELGDLFLLRNLSQDEILYAINSLIKSSKDINYEVRCSVSTALEKSCKEGFSDIVRDRMNTLSENGAINIQEVRMEIKDLEHRDLLKEIIQPEKSAVQQKPDESKDNLIGFENLTNEAELASINPEEKIDFSVFNKEKLSEIKQKQKLLNQEAELKGFGEREAEWAPKVVLPDEKHGTGEAWKFESPEMIRKYGEKYRETEKKVSRSIKYN